MLPIDTANFDRIWDAFCLGEVKVGPIDGKINEPRVSSCFKEQETGSSSDKKLPVLSSSSPAQAIKLTGIARPFFFSLQNY